MIQVKVKGFKIWRDLKYGWRCYHRATGEKVDCKKFPPPTAAFYAECHRIAQKHTPLKVTRNSFGYLVSKYIESAAFKELSERTQKDYRGVLEYLRPFYEIDTSSITPPVVVKIRDKAAKDKGHRSATYIKQVMSLVFNWGIERGYTSENPAAKVKGVKRPKNKARANRPWTDEERAVVLEAAHPSLALPIALCMFTGMRKGDALNASKNCYDGQNIRLTTSKSDTPISWPAPAPLRRLLTSSPATNCTTLCANSVGNPWKEDSFNTAWQRLKRQLEEEERISKGLTIHGLRHTVATILKELGYDDRTIADALGQKTLSMANHYSRDANLNTKMGGVVKSFDADLARRDRKVSKTSQKSVKKD